MKLKNCWARRHMTPSQFMVYDAMYHMTRPPDRLCFSSILGVANKTSLGRDTVIKCIKELVESGWLISDPDSSVRWKNTGRWANNRYTVVTHDEFKGGCPPLKYDPDTGENVYPSADWTTVSKVSTRTESKISTRTESKVSTTTVSKVSTQALDS